MNFFKREKQVLEIGRIELLWSNWYPWHSLKIDARTSRGISIPNKEPGVYEVRFLQNEKRLVIGKTGDLRFRIKQGLIGGKAPHSSGERLRDKEDVSKLFIRWAETNRPAAAEEELHFQHKQQFSGKLPTYVKRT